MGDMHLSLVLIHKLTPQRLNYLLQIQEINAQSQSLMSINKSRGQLYRRGTEFSRLEFSFLFLFAIATILSYQL
jgi:hypothetical protein